jgi:serine protease
MTNYPHPCLRRLVLTCMTAATLGIAHQAVAASTDIPTGFIVHLDPQAKGALTRLNSMARRAGVSGAQHVRTLATGGELFEVSAADATQVMRQLAADPAVLEVEPDLRMHRSMSGDPRWAEQWSLHDSRVGSEVPVAWRLSRGAGVTVAVIDTGITVHEDLVGQVLPGYDFISSAAAARDGDGRDADAGDQGDWMAAGDCGGAGRSASSWHGTHVSGTIAAVAGNGKGIAGIAPAAKILPVRVLGRCGGSSSDIAESMIWAAGGKVAGVPLNPHPARVLNLSLGGFGQCGTTLRNAVRRANELGATVIVAAGNDGVDVSKATPANCPGVVPVAAAGRNGGLAGYSNFGALVALTAQGGSSNGVRGNDILSTVNAGSTVPTWGTYAFSAGTSMATPHVAAAAALMLGVNPALTPAQVREYLVDTTRPMPVRCAKACGTGLLDAGAAVQAVADEL